MKSLILGFTLILSAQAFAQISSIAGVWHMPFMGDPKGQYSPESLVEISDKNTMKSTMLFPGTSQKQIRIIELVATSDGKYKEGKVLSVTKCDDTSFNSDGRNPSISMVVTNDQLVIAGQVKLNRATAEQIKKFEALEEGCK